MLSRNDLSPIVKSLLSRKFIDLPSTVDGPIQCNNAYFLLRPFFTNKAGKTLHNKVYSLIHQRNEVKGHEGLMRFVETLGIKSAKDKYGYVRVVDMVNFFGFMATEDNLDLAFAQLINVVNDLAERDYITGAMSPLSIIELSRTPENPFERKFCVVSYLAINHKYQSWVDSNLTHATFKEGGIPNEAK